MGQPARERTLKRIFLALLILCGGGHAESIGEQNHNPGNIRSIHWQQWQGAMGLDPWLHLRFASDEAGFKAIRRVLRAYYYKHHLNTCRGVAYRWIGIHHTQKQKDDYCKMLCQELGAGPDQKLVMDAPWTMQHLARGIVKEETGRNAYPDSLYRQIFN